ncbi:MAG: hypothetical protein P8P85_12665 [Acidimicrobiales bacterium]|nr:hypothetical protein [Acidimicrobiales bacterium]
MDGDELYAFVEEYEHLGIHRAGTEVDKTTVDWYEQHLQALGLTTERSAVPFDRYAYDSELMADGEPIEHLPLFYEWTGSVDTVDVALIDLGDEQRRFGSSHFEATELVAATGAEAGVLATVNSKGSLKAANRVIRDRHGKPTVLIAGRDLERVRKATERRLRMTATRSAATTENLMARNEVPGVPLLLTTPLTGWFQCSGERGTGAAVLLDMIERFASCPVLVLATGGHELDYFGVREWVAAGAERVAAIAHVGASVGCDEVTEDGSRRPIHTRIARTDAQGATADEMEALLAAVNYRFVGATDSWGGESEVLCDLGVPMLSVTGAGADFHTPADITADVTSPATMRLVSDAIAASFATLVRSIS